MQDKLHIGRTNLSESQHRPAEHPGGLRRPGRPAVTGHSKAPALCRAGAGGPAVFLILGLSQRWWQEAQLPPQPSPFQPPFLEIQITARVNSTISTTRVTIPRTVNIETTSFLCRLAPVYTIFAPRGNGCRAKNCRRKLFFAPSQNFSPLPEKGAAFCAGRAIISLFRFGGLAQLVRAPASHAGGQ